ncbi:MAG: nitrile hydratase subunit alpha, partial [Gammaproteobacteria bacterium]|nr:nitrile hydratase subunit alpha [Gammaproteobacteria bacterium]
MSDDHKHAPMVDEVSEFEILEIAVRELAIEKGLFTQEDHNKWTEYMHTLGPLPAARLVAQAWLDPEFKKLAVENGVKTTLAGGIA